MLCDDLRDALLASRNNAAELEADAHEHLETCAECQSYAGETEALDALLARDEDEEPRPGFDTRFFARLDELKSRPTGSWFSRYRWLFAGAAAAATTAAVILSLSVGGEPTGSMADDIDLAMHLDLLEELEMIRALNDVEAFETLAYVDPETLDAVIRELEVGP